jgi:6-phosphogluconolactonase
MIERLFEDEAAMVAALAAEIVERIEDGVAARGHASLVLAGGSTPAPLYEALSRSPAPWENVWITLSDERWVGAEAADSNERMLRERLLKDAAAGAHLIPLQTDDPSPRSALGSIDARIAAMPRPFDAVVLGMGEDGHFASLFPGPSSLAGLDPICAENVIAVEAPGAAGSAHRLSLTLAALTDSRWIALMIRGQPKLRILRQPGETPIAALLAQARAPIEVFWAR